MRTEGGVRHPGTHVAANSTVSPTNRATSSVAGRWYTSAEPACWATVPVSTTATVSASDSASP